MSTAIYTIALDFDSLAKAFWAILSYQLAYLGFAVVFARSSDFLGRRNSVLSAYILFVGFSLACGWSRNIDQLIVFRTFQGVGGAGLYSLAIILLVETSTAKLQPIVSSLIGATIAISGVLGPILGGVLTQYASWRWIFWINGPAGVVGIACFTIGWPHRTTAYDSTKRRYKEFDYIGAFLIMTASVLVVFGLQEAGTGEHAWNSSVVLGTLITGCLSWILLVAWESYVHLRYRDTLASMFPIEVITNRPLMAGAISTTLTGFTFFLLIVSLPLRFQIVNLKSPAAAGIHLLPLLCCSGVGGTLGGMASKKKNHIFETFMVSGSLILLGTGLLSTLGSGVGIEAKCYGFQVIVGLGVGATFAGISIMTAVSTTHRTHSVAQGIAAQMRIFGGSIGTAASNAIFNATCATQLVGILTVEQIRALQTNTRIVGTLDEIEREAVRLAYADSFEKSLRICVYVAAAGLVVSAFTWQKNPPKMQTEPKQARALEGSQDAGHIQVQADEEIGVEKARV